MDSDDSPVLANTGEVLTGSTCGSIYLKVDAQNTVGFGTAIPRIYMSVQKNPGNVFAFTDPSSVGDSDLKKYVIHQEMTMLSEITGTISGITRTVFQGVIIIPRGYKRNGTDDRLGVNFSHGGDAPAGAQTQICIQCIYKEFR